MDKETAREITDLRNDVEELKKWRLKVMLKEAQKSGEKKAIRLMAGFSWAGFTGLVAIIYAQWEKIIDFFVGLKQ